MPSMDNILHIDQSSRDCEKLKETKEEKILRLQKLVDDGSYEVSADKVAQSILESELKETEAKNRKNSKK